MSTSYKDQSRKQWATDENAPTHEQIQIGCLQRIADATEKMAVRHTELIQQRDSYERSADFWRAQSEKKDRRVVALRGQITKLRKKLAGQRQAEGDAHGR